MHRGIISWRNGFKKQGKIGEGGHPDELGFHFTLFLIRTFGAQRKSCSCEA